MERTFVNPLAYSRILRSVMIGALVFVVVVDVLVVFLLVKVSNYATPEERGRLLWLVVPLLLSSVAGFPLFYFIHRTIREQWIKTSDQGIRYNSLGRKISASWDEVTSVSIVSRGRYGQALRTKGLLIDTSKGKIYALPTFVDKSKPIPQLRMGISSQRLLYPNGKINNMGALLRNMDYPDEALRHYEEALGIYREFFRRYPSAYVRNFLVALRGIMAVYEKLGMEEKMKECRREMEEIIEAVDRGDAT